jgi:hypothetical protein
VYQVLSDAQLVAIATRSDTDSQNRLDLIRSLVPPHYVCNGYIRVITILPNSEQSYKGKVKTHKFINRQNQSTTGKLDISKCQRSNIEKQLQKTKEIINNWNKRNVSILGNITVMKPLSMVYGSEIHLLSLIHPLIFV